MLLVLEVLRLPVLLGFEVVGNSQLLPGNRFITNHNENNNDKKAKKYKTKTATTTAMTSTMTRIEI